MSDKMTAKRRKTKRALTAKQRLFIAAYLENGMNATRAAMAAGYKGEYKTVQRMGSENLSKPLIKKAIEAKLRQRIMGADEVLAQLTDIAKSSADDFVMFPEQLLDSDRTVVVRDGETIEKALTRTILEMLTPEIDLREAKAHGKLNLVKKIGYNRQGRMEIELYDRQAALNTLAKYHKLLTDRIVVVDWRKEAEAEGLPADELFGKRVADMESALSNKDKAE